jgi:hypothetical protein
MRISKAIVLLGCLALSARMTSAACPMSPLVLDLNGDGVQTTDLFAPVSFDLNGDGISEVVAWTCGWTEEGFLWLDLNRNGTVDGGRELFSQGTLLPSGETAANGFEALSVYDSLSYGGNADRVISEDDMIWNHLRLWVDRNRIVNEKDGWTIRTADRSLAAHFEHTLAITRGRPVVLTAA